MILQIPLINRTGVLSRVEKLKSLSIRNFGKSLDYTESDIYVCPVWIENKEYMIEYTDFEIDFADLLKIDGYTLIAKIEHTDHGNIIHKVNDSYDLSSYNFASQVCDHCGTNRYRNNTYLLDKNNELIMVGGGLS